MKEYAHYLPIASTIFSIIFTIVLAMHYNKKRHATYILWWMIGIIAYGAGTLTESINTIFGWSELNFRLWFVLGALMGGAPLAQGTVYLVMNKTFANVSMVLLVLTILGGAIAVFMSPVNQEAALANTIPGTDFVRMTGKGTLEWQWVRYISPFVNLYAMIFLVGGAAFSAYRYYTENGSKARFIGNVCISVGALLPGIGGTMTRFGEVEVLYVTELLGLTLIYTGYTVIKNDKGQSLHKNQSVDA